MVGPTCSVNLTARRIRDRRASLVCGWPSCCTGPAGSAPTAARIYLQATGGQVPRLRIPVWLRSGTGSIVAAPMQSQSAG